MDCSLCKKPIQKYDVTLNHLIIDESNSADICQDCIDKFFKWQQGIFAQLFPTNALKKRYGRD
jgi:hypothetical protein